MDLTHPDILEMERDGFLGEVPKVIAKCCVRGCEIFADEDHYIMENGDIVCDNCDLDYMRRFRKVGA